MMLEEVMSVRCYSLREAAMVLSVKKSIGGCDFLCGGCQGYLIGGAKYTDRGRCNRKGTIEFRRVHRRNK